MMNKYSNRGEGTTYIDRNIIKCTKITEVIIWSLGGAIPSEMLLFLRSFLFQNSHHFAAVIFSEYRASKLPAFGGIFPHFSSVTASRPHF